MAVTHLPEPHPTDPVVEQLANWYRTAYDATLVELQRAVVAGLSTWYREQLLLQLGRRLAELRAVSLAWAYGPVDPLTGARLLREGALYRAIAQADRETLRQLAGIGLTVEVPPVGGVAPSFSLLNDRAIRIAADNLVQSLDGAITQFDTSVRGIIGRASNDIFRRETLQTVGEKLTEGLTTRQARARLAADLAERGIPAFVDSKGRPWNLKSYADMAIRTNTREAVTDAVEMRLEAEGQDLVMISKHSPTCGPCAGIQGKVYSLSGRTPGYPRKTFKIPLHSNCGHVETPYSPKYDPEAEATRLFSNLDADLDPRSEAEIANYERSQAINRERALKRKLTTQMQSPGLDEATLDRLRARRAAANRRLIDYNKQQRKAFPGWR
jgi:hypothetical protein